MKLQVTDSLNSVQAMLAFEAELDGPLVNRFPSLKLYLLTPFEAHCANANQVIRVLIFAARGSTSLFASFGTASYGVGVRDGTGYVRDVLSFPSLDLAAQQFLGVDERAE